MCLARSGCKSQNSGTFENEFTHWFRPNQSISSSSDYFYDSAAPFSQRLAHCTFCDGIYLVWIDASSFPLSSPSSSPYDHWKKIQPTGLVLRLRDDGRFQNPFKTLFIPVANSYAFLRQGHYFRLMWVIFWVGYNDGLERPNKTTPYVIMLLNSKTPSVALWVPICITNSIHSPHSRLLAGLLFSCSLPPRITCLRPSLFSPIKVQSVGEICLNRWAYRD